MSRKIHGGIEPRYTRRPGKKSNKWRGKDGGKNIEDTTLIIKRAAIISLYRVFAQTQRLCVLNAQDDRRIKKRASETYPISRRRWYRSQQRTKQPSLVRETTTTLHSTCSLVIRRANTRHEKNYSSPDARRRIYIAHTCTLFFSTGKLPRAPRAPRRSLFSSFFFGRNVCPEPVKSSFHSRIFTPSTRSSARPAPSASDSSWKHKRERIHEVDPPVAMTSYATFYADVNRGATRREGCFLSILR